MINQLVYGIYLRLGVFLENCQSFRVRNAKLFDNPIELLFDPQRDEETFLIGWSIASPYMPKKTIFRKLELLGNVFSLEEDNLFSGDILKIESFPWEAVSK